MTNVDRNVVIITGAASGLGLAIAKRMASDRNHLVLIDRADSIQSIAEELSQGSHTADGIVVDLEFPQQVTALTEKIRSDYGRCDILVNNAGIHPKNRGKIYQFDEISLDNWNKVYAINVVAPFLLMQGLLPNMVAREWGRIINISSRSARTFIAGAAAHYSSSKAAVIGMTRSVAGQYAEYGITANCIAPGRIDTPLSNRSSQRVIQAALRDIPMGRVGTPDEIADTTYFLASEGAGYITGAVIDVNGGGWMG